MKRLGFVLIVLVVCLALSPTVALAGGITGTLLTGHMLPMTPFPGGPSIEGVHVNDWCYGAAAWAGFTRGVAQNAPNFLYCTYKVTGPDGFEFEVTKAGSKARWTGVLWDPRTCAFIGELVPFNSHIGAEQYMMGWFTPAFQPPVAGTYTVHATIVQTRPAVDLMQLVDPETGMVLKGQKAIAWPAGVTDFGEWTFEVAP